MTDVLVMTLTCVAVAALVVCAMTLRWASHWTKELVDLVLADNRARQQRLQAVVVRTPEQLAEEQKRRALEDDVFGIGSGNRRGTMVVDQ